MTEFRRIEIVDYDPSWAAEFARLAERARGVLGGLAVAIEHVGSTGVPGLAAKPIVDLDVVIASRADLPEAIRRLAICGYEHRGDLGISGREAFHFPVGEARHHLYVLAADAAHLRQHLVFRDALRADPALAAAYAALKRNLAARFPEDINSYLAGKTAFIESVLSAGSGTAPVELVLPDHPYLPLYVAALRTGWSPSTMRNVSSEQLAAIEADAEKFLAELRGDIPGIAWRADGTQVPRLPGTEFWIWDGSFCGVMKLRQQPGTEALPPHVSGHVGYSVVPWKQGRGIATQALRMLLPIAAARGLSRVLITCDEDNFASRRVIEKNGGVPAGTALDEHPPGHGKLLFWVSTKTADIRAAIS